MNPLVPPSNPAGASVGPDCVRPLEYRPAAHTKASVANETLNTYFMTYPSCCAAGAGPTAGYEGRLLGGRRGIYRAVKNPSTTDVVILRTKSSLRNRGLPDTHRTRARAEGIQKCERDPARHAGSDSSIVDLNDRDDFARRARQEALVCTKEIVVFEDGLPDVDAGLGAYFEDERAGDAGQQARVDRRRQRGAVLHDEEIRLRALRQLAAVVPHDALEAAMAKRLLHREGVVDQAVRLDQRIDRSGMVAHRGDQGHFHAALKHLRRRIDVRLHDDDY